MLLPRENLPLSALDLSRPHGDFPVSRLFESKIKILDLEGRLGSNMLLARSETTRMVYAVERESSGLYVLCKLGSWVDIELLSQKATVVCMERMRSGKPVKQEDTAAVALTTPSMYNEGKRRKLAIEEIQSMVRKRSMSVIEKTSPNQTATATEESPESKDGGSQNTDPVQQHTETPVGPGPSRSETPALEPARIDDDPLSQPDAGDIFQSIRAQYMEALYHSKVLSSLANVFPRVLTRAGLVGVFCKRAPFQGQSCIPPGLGLQP